jgi:hypothetical protein
MFEHALKINGLAFKITNLGSKDSYSRYTDTCNYVEIIM